MATPFDAAAKDLIDMAPADWLAFLGQPRPPELVRVIDADLSTTVTTSTDKVIRVDDPEPWLLLIELQAAWDGDLPFDLLRRYALLRHRHRLPVSCAIVLLRPEANTSAMTGVFPQPDRLGRDWDFPFHVVRVWETPAEALARGPLGMAAFAPVAGVDQDQVPDVLLEVKDRMFREAPRARADTLWAATLILLRLRYDRQTIRRWRGRMKTMDLSNNPVIEIFREEEAIETVLRIGAKKFGAPAPADVETAIRAIEDLPRLHDLQTRVLDVATWQDLLAGPAA
jgi:hypothetical protein